MKLKKDKIIKGFLFAGCSFTWGQGLYYYSGMSSVKEQPLNTYKPEILHYTHIEFAKSLRYPRLVANYFNSFELVHPACGGSHESIIKFWDCAIFKNGGNVDDIHVPNIDANDIQFVIFQLTQPHRCTFSIGKKQVMTYCDALEPENRRYLRSWMKKNKIPTIEKYVEWYTIRSLTSVRQFMSRLEDIGIKTAIFTWPATNVQYCRNDDWLRSRYISMRYKSSAYNSIERMMEDNQELCIHADYDNFDITPTDSHPSLLCHKVMAENIINYINIRGLNE